MLLLVVAALLHTAVTAFHHGSGKCAEPKYMCHQANGDGAGGTEALVKTNVASLQDCFKLVTKADSNANGATWGKKNKKCYKEVGMTKINSNSNYVTCYILLDTSGRRRALAAEKAVGQFSWMDAQPEEGPNKATYHKKGGEACAQHYECKSRQCIWTSDMSGHGSNKPKGDIHCGDGYHTTSCDACTYGEDEPDWCGGDCEWDGWECVEAMESQVGFRDAETDLGQAAAAANGRGRRWSDAEMDLGQAAAEANGRARRWSDAEMDLGQAAAAANGRGRRWSDATSTLTMANASSHHFNLLTYGFAAIGLGALFYGAGQHFFAKEGRRNLPYMV